MKKFLPYILILIVLVGIFPVSSKVQAYDSTSNGICVLHQQIDRPEVTKTFERTETVCHDAARPGNGWDFVSWGKIGETIGGLEACRWHADGSHQEGDLVEGGGTRQADGSLAPLDQELCTRLAAGEPGFPAENVYWGQKSGGTTSPNYTLLAPLPCPPNTDGCNGTFSTFNPTDDSAFCIYLNLMIKIFLGICAVLAVIMIVMGGIEYMTSELISNKEAGKEKILHAIFGLLLALGAWVILNQINSDLIKCKVTIPQQEVTITTTTVPVNFLSAPADIAEDAQNRSVLAANGITAPGPCANGVTKNCVNLNSLNDNTMIGVEALATACKTHGCSVVITGGTEGGHAANGEHPDGSALDIRSDPALNALISSNPQPCASYPGPGGGTYLWEVAGSKCGGPVGSSAPHWHVSYP